MSGIHSFPASQKLKSRKVIGQLFERGNHIKAFPIKGIFSITEFNPDYHGSHLQMGISVPKRSFKNAVDRNRIKRQVREVYRMHHAQLMSEAKKRNIYLAVMLIYIDRKEPNFLYLDQKVKSLIAQLSTKLKHKKS